MSFVTRRYTAVPTYTCDARSEIVGGACTHGRNTRARAIALAILYISISIAIALARARER